MSQRQLVTQFISFTGSTDRTAQKFLKQHQWSLNAAVDGYFSEKASSKRPALNGKAIEKIFEKYKDPGEDYIGFDGTFKFFEAIGVDLEDKLALAIAYSLQSPTVGQFPRQGFIEGWKELGCDTLEKMRAKVPEIRRRFDEDDSYFKQIYLFTFPFIRPEGKRALDQNTASEYWNMLLASRFSLLQEWIEFLQQKNIKEGMQRPVQKDTWNMLFEFSNYCKSDPQLSSYNEEAAFPSIIDEFVHYYKAVHLMSI